MFIIDFDDTLIDTHAQKHARMELLKSIGVSEELYWKTYAMARVNDEGRVVYSHTRHAQILKEFGFDEQEVLTLSESVTEQSKKFLFQDALLFLEAVKRTGETLILLSLGDALMQERRVKQTGIHTFFDRVFFVDDTKVHVVKEILDHHKSEKVWFINDKVKETLEVVQACPSVTPVLRQSPSIPLEEYVQSTFPYFENLTEILHYVEQSH